jgi:hypothetical protein
MGAVAQAIVSLLRFSFFIMPLISGFDKSPHAKEIRQRIAQAKMDGQSLFSLYKEIKVLDPNVPNYSRFRLFSKKIAELIEEEPSNDSALLDRAIEKSIAIGDLVLEQTLTEIKKDVEEGKVIPWQKRKDLMKWFNDSGNMELRKRFIDIKNKQGMASIAAMALLADAARYGKIQGEDINIIEGQTIDGDISSSESVPQLDGAGTGADTGTS